ncbi:hypothetical protein M427DRAFT_43971 [Gonapodya prolifera JEL478]|uniref:Uncharacterized protein n=1 Tax=Gonapodya prolifera (strain JEL478) TaxID=1344416 RepID=A0A139AIC3_GONPJ|nr:hypothetical protein M427DRAFT_43971 [Gonapodya prolifera JEL478]|eukprot:KXS16173.1 hypothetical protein M427DRAFT_43971 [Gonapodya prolifera JEL478]
MPNWTNASLFYCSDNSTLVKDSNTEDVGYTGLQGAALDRIPDKGCPTNSIHQTRTCIVLEVVWRAMFFPPASMEFTNSRLSSPKLGHHHQKSTHNNALLNLYAVLFRRPSNLRSSQHLVATDPGLKHCAVTVAQLPTRQQDTPCFMLWYLVNFGIRLTPEALSKTMHEKILRIIHHIDPSLCFIIERSHAVHTNTQGIKFSRKNHTLYTAIESILLGFVLALNAPVIVQDAAKVSVVFNLGNQQAHLPQNGLFQQFLADKARSAYNLKQKAPLTSVSGGFYESASKLSEEDLQDLQQEWAQKFWGRNLYWQNILIEESPFFNQQCSGTKILRRQSRTIRSACANCGGVAFSGFKFRKRACEEVPLMWEDRML